jgi:signal transduction histidine kinase/ActR/RegA family two-component response regulator
VSDDVYQETDAELYEHAPCGYVSAQPNGIIVRVNQTLLSWLGLEREQLIGKRRFQELLTIPGQIFFENHFHPILLVESQVNEVALDLKIPGRHPLPTLVSGVLKRDESGAPFVTRFTVFNATQRRAYEQDLLKKTKELNLLNARKNELLGMAAHDLRTPLGAISTYSNLLASEVGHILSPIHREFLDTILDMSAFMSELITDILDVTAIESGSLRLDRKSKAIEPILRRAISINAVLSRKKGITIEHDLDEGETFCLIDHRKIDQVLNNLLGNASKYSHSGTTIKVSLRIDSDQVTIAIRDQGQGIPADELGKIFTPFKMGSIGATAGEHSTGLGLAIVHSIVTGHGGKIWVTSAVGVGSTFSFTLSRSAPPELPAEKLAGASAVLPAISRATRVLVAEDNVINQKVATLMLTKVGADTVIARNGREVLALLKQADPDIVFMDCQMPEMDGYEAAAAIRAIERAGDGKRLPIIALTASNAESDRQRCLAAGMDDFLEKPLKISHLEEMLKRWVRNV